MDPTEDVADILGRWREEAEQGRYVDPESLLESHPEHADVLGRDLKMQGLVDQYFADADALPLLTPERLGDYRIVREVGRGGMGVVYEAEQESMQRRVALKVLYPTIATTARTRKRFEREARLTGRLHHTNIVTVHAMGQQDGYFYFAMELVRGRPVDRIIKGLRTLQDGEALSESLEGTTAELRGRGSHQRIAAMAAAVADALQVAHAQGIVHRDVKPSNLVLDEEGILKLTDFGLAHLVGEDLGVTRTGEVIGTPMYMSPEQVRARREDVDHRTDIYSLGATLYELLTLKPLHDGGDFATLCSQILKDEPATPRQLDPSIPKDLATIVEKALQKERGDRYASAADMARDLRSFSKGLPIEARRPTVTRRVIRAVKRRPVRAGMAATIALLVVIGAVLFADYRLETSRRMDAEYELLLIEAQEDLPEVQSHSLEHGGSVLTTSGGRYGSMATIERAIALKPDRFEAWFLRALLAPSSVPLDRRLEDIQRAQTRGLPTRTALLARAHLSAKGGRTDLAAHLTAEAQGLPSGGPRDMYFEGDLLVREGRRAEGAKLLSRVLKDTRPTDQVHIMAVRSRARAFEALGDWGAAVTDLAIAAHHSPEDGALRLRLARAWRELEHMQQATEVLEETLDLAKAGSEADWLHLLFAADVVGWQDWRLRIHEAAQAAMPASARIAARYGVELSIHGKYARAKELLDAAVREAIGPDRRRVRQHLAHFHLEHGSTEEAKRVWGGLLEQDRDDYVSLVNIGICHMRLGELEQAMKVLQRAVQINAHEATAHSNLAELYVLCDTPKKALVHARMGVRLNGHSWGSYHVLAVTLDRLGQRDEADVATRRAVALCRARGSARQLFILARQLGEHGRSREALTLYLGVLSLDPEMSRIHHNLAIEHRALGNRDEAIVALREELKREPDASDFHDLGLHLAQRGEWADAVAHLHRAAKLDQSLSGSLLGTYYNWGNWLLRSNRLKEAAAKYRQLILLDDAHVGAHTNLGAVLYKLGEIDAAITASRAALSIDPTSAIARANLAHALHVQGKPKEAIKEYEIVLAAHPEHSGAIGGLRKSRALHSLLERMPRVLAGKERPRDALDALFMAERCNLNAPRDPLSALRLYRLAFQEDPNLMNAQRGNRYNAACAAVLAKEPSQAITWLRADLADWKRLIDESPAAVAQTLSYWRVDTDLASIRDDDGAGADAVKLWRDVAAVLEQARRAAAK